MSREAALAAFRAALTAVDPRPLVARALAEGPLPEGPVTVFALGKAAPGMARGALDQLGKRVVGGLVIPPHGTGGVLGPLDLVEAGHPVPDAGSLEAARRTCALVDSLGPDDVLLALISGGGSALLADPAPPLDLGGLQARTDELLASGEDIEAVNAWRIAHSTLKGGRLGRRARPAQVHTLVLCDVPGHPELVASGPTAGVGPLVTLADVDTAVDAAIAALEAAGWPVQRLPRLEGEARELGAALGARFRKAKGPRAWVGGGETTVTLRGDGTGGRCQELATAAAVALRGAPVVLLAAGTDGRDGPTELAGAIVDGRSADTPGAEAALARSDTGSWVARAGAPIRIGPTGTNVNDLLIALRGP